MKNNFAVIDDIRRYTGERDAQVTGEVERVGKANAELLKQFGQVFALNKTTGIHILLTDGQTRGEDVGVLFLAIAETLVAQVFLISDDVTPVLHTYHGVERMGIVTDGIETADDTTHRRAGNDIDGDARPFQYLQHTDMGHALRTAATQHDGHFFSLGIFFLFLSTHQAAHQHGD